VSCGLPVETRRDSDWLSQINVASERPATDNLKKVGEERHVAVPSDVWPFAPADWQSGKTRVSDVDRLNNRIVFVRTRCPQPDRFEMGRAEAQDAIAVAGRAFGEQNNRQTGTYGFGHQRVDRWDAGAATAIDVDDPLQSDDALAGAMLSNLFLCQKAHRLERAKDRNVKPGNMVSDNQLLRPGAECAMPPHLDPETGAYKPVEEHRDTSPSPRAANLSDAQGRAKYSQKRQKSEN
jgi:hypothetical protein